jgi:hypothetical protein
VSARRAVAAGRLMTIGAVLAVALVAAPAACAASGLGIGFANDPMLTSGNSAITEPWIGRAVSEGAGIVRVNVTWQQIAPQSRPAGFRAGDPGSPGYDWTTVDTAVRNLSARGLKVLIMIYLAPTWGQGPNRPASARNGTWEPDPAQFAAFARAAAVRYSGSYPDPTTPGAVLPRVRYWQGWNEPNLGYYLAPQWTQTRSGLAPASPGVYRSLLNAFYAAVKGVSPSNVVLMAGTSPYGDPAAGQRSVSITSQRMRPVAFDRGVFCLSAQLKALSCPGPTMLDVFDHHPYDIKGPTHPALNADDATVPDVSKISRVLSAAERAGRVLPRGSKSFWTTEISWDTNPPDPNGVPTQTQARWLEQALFILWRQGVSTVLCLQIRDSPPIPSYAATYQGGLYYLGGAAKPAATAFRFPFVINRLTRSRLQAWGRSPSTGKLTIEERRSGRWVAVSRLSLRAGQVFSTTLRLTGSATLRARTASDTSLSWTQGA